MKKVVINLKRIEVTQFSPAKAQAQVSIWFEHSSPQVLQWTVKEADKFHYTKQMLADIRNLVKQFHPSNFSGDEVEDLLQGHCVVMFKDEDAYEEKLGIFLGKLIDQLKKLRNSTSATGYLSKVASFDKMGVDF